MNPTTLNNNERLAAVYGLLATKSTNDQPACPSDELLAQFIDNKLTMNQRNTMLTHLNECSSCYQLLIETSTLLFDSKQVAETTDWQELLVNNL
jgi:hypothetical protein